MNTTVKTPPRAAKQLKSTQAAADYSKAWFQDLRKAVLDDGRPYVLSSAEMPHEIFDVLGLPVVTVEWWGGVIAAKRAAGRYLDALGAQGFHEDLGAYSTLGTSSLLVEIDNPPWGGLPKPAMLAVPFRDQALPRVYELVARKLGVPWIGIEIPAVTRFSRRWWEEARNNWEDVYEAHRIDHLQEEFRHMTAMAERISGRRLDERALAARVDRVNEQEAYFDEARRMVVEAPKLPVRVAEQMTNTMTAQWHRGSDWAVSHARSFRDEVGERVRNGDCVTPNERLRLMWVGVGLWHNTDFYAAFEESHGAVFVWSMYMAIAADGYIRYGWRDPTRALASRYLNLGEQMHSAPTAGEWLAHEAGTHRVDAAVMIIASSQLTHVNGNNYQRQALERAGVPVLEIVVDPNDERSWNEAAIRAEITKFLEQL
ncbi:MAG: 2-hydroxyacyl-CoA dehydratase [Rhizobiaceae bacterium]